MQSTVRLLSYPEIALRLVPTLLWDDYPRIVVKGVTVFRLEPMQGDFPYQSVEAIALVESGVSLATNAIQSSKFKINFEL